MSHLSLFRFAASLLGVVALAFPGMSAAPASGFKPTPDHQRQAGVPRGTVTPLPAKSSKIFPGITRDGWIYVPAQYRPDGSAAVIIFQDGEKYLDETGHWRAPVVLDNLIARGDMPVTVAIFLNPGHDPLKGPPVRPDKPSNRILEYDSLGDR